MHNKKKLPTRHSNGSHPYSLLYRYFSFMVLYMYISTSWKGISRVINDFFSVFFSSPLDVKSGVKSWDCGLVFAKRMDDGIKVSLRLRKRVKGKGSSWSSPYL